MGGGQEDIPRHRKCPISDRTPTIGGTRNGGVLMIYKKQKVEVIRIGSRLFKGRARGAIGGNPSDIAALDSTKAGLVGQIKRIVDEKIAAAKKRKSA
jgi:hypothetical protein